MTSIQLRTCLVAAVLVAGACSDDTAPAPAPKLQDFISGVTLTTAWIFPEEANTLSVAAAFREGTVPHQNFGPSLFGCTYDALQPELAAGTTFHCVSGAFSRSDELATVYVWLAETPGYWEITLPQPLGSEVYGVNLEYDIQINAAAPDTAVNLRITGSDEAGNAGVIVSRRITVVPAPATNADPDVRAVLTWTGASDLDLHVVDPFGHDVSVFNPTTAEGGLFGGDSNGACTIDGINRESIVWPGGKAPAGEYRVYVNYYNDCGVATSPFQVQLDLSGQDGRQLSGEFSGPAAAASPQTVGTLTIE